jgi:hypothetical protein
VERFQSDQKNGVGNSGNLMLERNYRKRQNRGCQQFAKGFQSQKKTKQRMSVNTIGRYSGENHPKWLGGVSFAPYCQKFNEEFKNRVRAFFGYKCAECEVEQNGTAHHVHHVNFDKMSCCNGTEPLFVPLCVSCHGRTQKNRDYWETHFTDLIKVKYGGKCYFTKEEFEGFGLIPPP